MKMITILGPTATGKTRLAACLASVINAEVISADSRQVYKGMDIGTGKDIQDYLVDGKMISYHLIDIVEAGYEYNLFEFQQDFHKAYADITARGKMTILCGGTGLYIQSVLQGYRLLAVAPDNDFRTQMEQFTDQELKNMLSKLVVLHNETETSSRKRMIRALEIAMFADSEQGKKSVVFDPVASTVFGISYPRDVIRNRITERLHARLENGMTEEVKALLNKGIPPEKIIYYGLEYKYLTLYLIGSISYDEMVQKLNIAIHQFSKRQMTWFRKMEREGFVINWIDGSLTVDEKISLILNKVNESGVDVKI